MAAIKLSGLRKQFGTVAAVKNINVTFENGKMTSVLGPSGCGKTTTLNMIAGFVEPDAGSIAFDERVVADPERHIAIPPHQRHLGMVFQSYALWPHLSIGENVGYGLKMRGIGRGERDAAVRKSLARVRLDGFVDRFPHELSGGQQQRVAIARAITYSPQILLFDEPLSNLDAQLREEMREELKSIHEEVGVTAVYVTHDQAEAMSLSDTIIVMGDGEILQRGTPRELYEKPADIRVATFIGKTNLLDATIVDHSQPYLKVRAAGISDLLLCRSPDCSGVVAGSLSIRPESIALKPLADRASGFEARISSALYLGDICRYEIFVGHGLRLQVQQSAATPLQVGDAVTAEIDPQRCYFIAGRSS